MKANPIALQLLMVATIALGSITVLPRQALADDGQDPHIVVEITGINYLRDVHSSDDWDDPAETKAIIVAERTCKGRAAALKLPTKGYVPMLPGQSTTEFSGSSLGACIDDTMSDIYFQLMLVDEDQLDAASDYALNTALDGIADALAARALALRTSVWASILVNAGLQYTEQKAKDYFLSADIMGETTIKLSRDEGWQSDGQAHTVSSTNEAVEFTYVVRVGTPLKAVPNGHPTSAGGTSEIAQNVYLRSGPGKEYSILHTLHAGDLVEELGEEYNGWIKVRYNGQDESFVGWVGGRNFFR